MPQPPPRLKPKSKSKSNPNSNTSKLQPSSPSSAPSAETLTQTHASLSPLLPILQAVAHRHHNQHSSSHWWRPFGLLRRATRSLAASLLRRPSQPDDETPAVVQAKWMASHIVPRAYVAFTQLTADNQHAPLGLMLLAVLARINRLLSDLVPSHHTSAETNSPSPSATVNPTSIRRLDPTPSSLEADTPDQDVDMGVTISRDDLTLTKSASELLGQSMAEQSPPKDTQAKDAKVKKLAKGSSRDVTKDASKNGKEKKKKKKKGGDAFSSLFNSL